MTLICEMNQRVVHTSGCCWPRHAVGDNSGIHVKIQIFRFLRLILGGDILRPPIFLSTDNRLQRSKLSPKAGTTGWTLSRFAGEYEPDALSAGIFATGQRCATLPNLESIQAGFKQAPPEAVNSYQKRKASNLILSASSII